MSGGAGRIARIVVVSPGRNGGERGGRGSCKSDCREPFTEAVIPFREKGHNAVRRKPRELAAAGNVRAIIWSTKNYYGFAHKLEQTVSDRETQKIELDGPGDQALSLNSCAFVQHGAHDGTQAQAREVMPKASCHPCEPRGPVQCRRAAQRSSRARASRAKELLPR